jgi:hypothetical protein
MVTLKSVDSPRALRATLYTRVVYDNTLNPVMADPVEAFPARRRRGSPLEARNVAHT